MRINDIEVNIDDLNSKVKVYKIADIITIIKLVNNNKIMENKVVQLTDYKIIIEENEDVFTKVQVDNSDVKDLMDKNVFIKDKDNKMKIIVTNIKNFIKRYLYENHDYEHKVDEEL